MFADRFRGKANVIDRVDLPGYGASDAHMQDDASGTLSVPLVNVAAVYFGRTRPAECSMPLTLACLEFGHDLLVKDGAALQPRLAARAQIYATGRLQRRVLETEGETSCRSEVACTAADVLALRGSDGRRPSGSPARRSWPAVTSQVSGIGSSALSLQPPFPTAD